jgi:hypothetical protein
VLADTRIQLLRTLKNHNDLNLVVPVLKRSFFKSFGPHAGGLNHAVI